MCDFYEGKCFSRKDMYSDVGLDIDLRSVCNNFENEIETIAMYANLVNSSNNIFPNYELTKNEEYL